MEEGGLRGEEGEDGVRGLKSEASWERRAQLRRSGLGSKRAERDTTASQEGSKDLYVQWRVAGSVAGRRVRLPRGRKRRAGDEGMEQMKEMRYSRRIEELRRMSDASRKRKGRAGRYIWRRRGLEDKGRRKSRGDGAVQVAGCPPWEL